MHEMFSHEHAPQFAHYRMIREMYMRMHAHASARAHVGLRVQFWWYEIVPKQFSFFGNGKWGKFSSTHTHHISHIARFDRTRCVDNFVFADCKTKQIITGYIFECEKKQIVRWEEKKNTALKGGPHETINIAAAKLCTSTRKHIVTKYDVHIRKVSLKIYNLSSLTSCTWHTQKMTKYDVCIILHEPHENNSPCTLHASTCAETSSCLLMLKSTISLPFRLNARCCMGYGRASTSPKPAKVNY